MSYSYDNEKKIVFTDAGQRDLLAVRDFCAKALKLAGAVRAGEAMNAAKRLGSSWEMMACVDRLVELDELREIPTAGSWQNRVFVSGRFE